MAVPTGEADLDPEGYVAAEVVLGPALLFELTTLVAHYSGLALTMRVFDIR